MAQTADSAWDAVVIGGGPAGMMAAGRAAELGARVLLIEKNPSLGKKLLITGGGRCNLTNAETDVRRLLAKYKENAKFLFSPFSRWSVAETLEFFNSRGMPTKEEAEQRIFPKSDSAQSVWDVLVQYLQEGGVQIRTESPASGLIATENLIQSVVTANGEEIRARNFVIATGGTSRPETGSTGDGFRWLRELGHTVQNPRASLVPLAIKNDWVKRLSGLSLDEINISTFQNESRQSSAHGKILFTHFGVSGPTILNMSGEIGELLKYGEVAISLDLFPKVDSGALDRKLQLIIGENINKRLKNTLKSLIPAALAREVIEISDIDPETPCHSITRESRKKLVELLKDLRVDVEDLLGLDKAIISDGGVDLREIEFSSMTSKLYTNLYLIGDILNINRPSGGYSLQLCWTTGHVAGSHIGNSLSKSP